MDNLGEAADLHRGIWPAEQPIGAHHSATTELPSMLSLLAQHDMRATYFIEGWNCAVYGPTIREVQARGHEVGFHAWQHEVWAQLDAATEERNLARGVEAAAAVGVAYSGFRPPGGRVTERTLPLMRAHGMRYLSPAAARPAVCDGVAMVPFQWECIDAYFYMASTAPLREARGDSKEPLSPEVLRERLCRRIDEVVEEGGYLALLFHPFLTVGKEKLAAMESVLEHVKSKGDEVLLAQCKDVADWVLSRSEAFGDDPGWDNAEWKKK